MPAANTTATDRKSSPRTPYAVRTPTARAKLTNGTRGMVLPGIDQRRLHRFSLDDERTESADQLQARL